MRFMRRFKRRFMRFKHAGLSLIVIFLVSRFILNGFLNFLNLASFCLVHMIRLFFSIRLYFLLISN